MSRPISVPLIQGSPEWHAWRRTGVGSSDISVITGDSHFGDPISLYQEKLGYAAPRVETPFMAAGKRLEDVVAAWYREDTGNPVRRVHRGLRSREQRFMIASLDRQARVERRLRPLEIKTADAPGDEWGRPGTDEIPDRYLEQVLWQAAVTSADVVDVAVFFFRTRRMNVYRVGRDQAVIDELAAYGADFWHHVEERTPPEPLGPPRSLLRADEVVANESLTELVALHDAAETIKKAAETDLNRVKDAIRAELARYGGARGEGFRIHYRYSADSQETDWERVALAYRTLIEEHGLDLTHPQWKAAVPQGLDGVVADLTTTKPGTRPLLVKHPKERTRAA